MEHLWHAYGWLLFPLAFYLFGALDWWISYRPSRANPELIEAYPPKPWSRRLSTQCSAVMGAPAWRLMRGNGRPDGVSRAAALVLRVSILPAWCVRS